jgi:[NiFe] hydrogenase diaphorase moiety large subunit
MMDIVINVQKELGCVSSDAMDLIARLVHTYRVEVESVVSFYSFLSSEKKGSITIRLSNDVIDRIAGFDRVAEGFREELGIGFGETTSDGLISLETTACIGMCDQAPAGLVNDVVITKLTREKAKDIARSLKEYHDPYRLVKTTGDGNNSHKLVHAMVENNIRLRGPVIFSDFTPGEALVNGLAMSPKELIREVKTARLRGRGGAGFPTGMKWEFARMAEGDEKFIICNADEGEPGTFKDRVLLTQTPNMVLEGMTLAGYALGAQHGIIYLRGEYAYLRPFLESVLEERRRKNLLGENIYSKKGFNFDVSIQTGAGAYICGEETALISSCEGLRGDPKNRPPFPAQKGYLGKPTVVNNVETFCCITKIAERGAGWFAQRGTSGSTGTKLLSVSGDCELPGVYEVPFGLKVNELLKLAGAFETMAVQIGGPSGQMIGPDDFERTICYDDLGTGGSVMIFDKRRSVMEIVHAFTEFFVEESCGYCTPCRVGNVLLKERIERIISGLGQPSDIDYLKNLGATIIRTSRCGLGQTSANPVLTSLKNFSEEYEVRVEQERNGLSPHFDILEALRDSSEIAGRKSVIFR